MRSTRAGPQPAHNLDDDQPADREDSGEEQRHSRSPIKEVAHGEEGRPDRRASGKCDSDDGELAWFLGSQVDLGLDAPALFDDRRARAVALVKQLPTRRRQVLELMARGLLNKQIAWALKISEKTVKMHRALLLEQLGVATSADAIRIAVEANL